MLFISEFGLILKAMIAFDLCLMFGLMHPNLASPDTLPDKYLNEYANDMYNTHLRCCMYLRDE